MKNIRLNKYLLIPFFICIIALNAVFADEAFKNNLLKVDLYESSLGGVKMTLYTNKPYSDFVRVNKKSDYEYIILMPETASSLTAKPSLKSVSGTIKDIEVKTQQYSNQIRGYTKIVISTSRPVEIIPSIEVLKTSQYQLSEKDYQELLSQKTAQKETVSTQKPTVSTPKEVKAPVVTKPEPAKTVQKPTVTKTAPTASTPKVEQKPVVQKTITAPKVEQKSVIQKPVIQKIMEQPKTTQTITKPQPKIESVQQPVGVTSVNSEETPIEETVQPEEIIEEKVQSPEVIQLQPPVTQNASATKTSKIIQKLKNIAKNIIQNNGKYTLVGMALIPVILFLLLLRIFGKTAQKLKKQKSEFVANLKEKPVKATDYSKKIQKDLGWKEKFKAYVDATRAQEKPIEQKPPVQEVTGPSELNDLFSDEELEVPEQNFGFTEAELPYEQGFPQGEIYQEEFSEYQQPYATTTLDDFNDFSAQEIPEEVSIEELFGEEELPFREEPQIVEEEKFEEFNFEAIEAQEKYEKQYEPVYESANQEEIVTSEYSIDYNKGFYLVDYADSSALVGHIADEIFVLKKFDKKIEGPLQARMDERTENSVNFMTKVGTTFKGVVQVTPKKMNLLIEL